MTVKMALNTRDEVIPDGWVRDGDWIVPWWHSKASTGVIVRWAIFLAIFVLIMGYIIGGYYHAQSRLRKGLPPLAYHRCLVGRRARQPQHQNDWPQDTYGYYQPNAYQMNNMPPPPVYDPSRPPVYSSPPDGGSKVDPSQWRSEPTRRPAEENPAPAYTAPAGPQPPSNTR
ncbi:Uncharacterized protein TCAP_01487 [Tolypocladium capitatum]|uniref:Uncharacterized protein n=1 Tax=Tolypocladium capitatum TaxID=45235 RepID=A0A2K3QM41_9HYPO|nr:Uncharacterized protein TCAP_01487 [Tolypocladium capitatum]